MYSVGLVARFFAREVHCIERRLAHSRKPSPNERRVRKLDYRNDTSQLAGVRHQAKSLGYTPDTIGDIADLDDEEFNLSAAEHFYDAHYGEMRWKKSKHTLAEYAQKYYKPKQEPALLSSDDMKEIRRLHTEENWPVNVLARSFPANEVIIEKVCKVKRVASLEEQFKHDEKVAKNWILLRKGKLEISDSLKTHCLKFTNRVARPMTSKDVAAINKKPSRPPGSFLNLIKPPDMEKEMEDEKKKELNSDCHDTSASTSTLGDVRQRITLEEIRKKELATMAKRGVGATDEDKLFLLGSDPTRGKSSQDCENKYVNPPMSAEGSVVTKVKTDNKIVSKWDSSANSKMAARQMMMAPVDEILEQIDIPETVKKSGAVYRVEDCFYNEDGQFLYRVPGLKFSTSS